MIEVLLLAIALSMDALAVAIGLGARHRHITLPLAAKAAIYFGLFQAVMPLAGYLGGRSLLGWVAAYAPWAAFSMLAFIGGKMIYESFTEDAEADILHVTHRVMLVLAVATSIDAMAAGFALNLLDFDPFAACGFKPRRLGFEGLRLASAAETPRCRRRTRDLRWAPTSPARPAPAAW